MIDDLGAVRWSLFPVAVTLIVIWASPRILSSVLPRFEVSTVSSVLPTAVSAIPYAMRISGARRGILCWMDRECHTGFKYSQAGSANLPCTSWIWVFPIRSGSSR